jgi:hypothetical protein
MKRNKTYTEANQVQKDKRDYCLERARNHANNDLQDVVIEDEKVLSFNGMLLFTIKIKAKPDTGMMFLCDKTFIVTIGRKGQVKSTKAGECKNLKVNKYCIFI